MSSAAVVIGALRVNSKKQTTKFTYEGLRDFFSSKLYHIENAKDRGQTVEVQIRTAHNEPPQLDPSCLHIQLF